MIVGILTFIGAMYLIVIVGGFILMAIGGFFIEGKMFLNALRGQEPQEPKRQPSSRLVSRHLE